MSVLIRFMGKFWLIAIIRGGPHKLSAMAHYKQVTIVIPVIGLPGMIALIILMFKAGKLVLSP